MANKETVAIALHAISKYVSKRLVRENLPKGSHEVEVNVHASVRGRGSVTESKDVTLTVAPNTAMPASSQALPVEHLVAYLLDRAGEDVTESIYTRLPSHVQRQRAYPAVDPKKIARAKQLLAELRVSVPADPGKMKNGNVTLAING